MSFDLKIITKKIDSVDVAGSRYPTHIKLSLIDVDLTDTISAAEIVEEYDNSSLLNEMDEDLIAEWLIKKGWIVKDGSI